MKNTFYFSARALFALVLLVASNSLVSCSKNADEPAVTYTITGDANATQAIPANASTGSAIFSGSYNLQTKTLVYTTTWTNLSDVPLSAGFYSGAAGEEGASINSWALGTNLSFNGTFSGTVVLSADQETQLLAGNIYYTIATAANANGEVRGQLKAVKN